MGLSAHQKNGGHDEWLTPPEILRALGAFDLDPCAPVVRPWETAARHYTVADDGLALPWAGRVWCNPPFGREAVKWLRRMRDHGNGVALIPARTETAMFYETVWGRQTACCSSKGARTSTTWTAGGRISTAEHPLPWWPTAARTWKPSGIAASASW